MKKNSDWMGAEQGEVLYLSVPLQGVLLAWIAGPENPLSKIAIADSSLLRKWIETPAEMRSWLQTARPCPSAQVRVIGHAQEIDPLLRLLTEQELPLGDPIRLSTPGQSICFFPASGKIRIPIGSRSSSKRKKVLVIDDSPTICKLLQKIINEDDALECVGLIQDPRVAVKEIQALRPDVITMDIHMPEITGIELVRQVMSQIPTPILLISSLSMSEGGEVLEGLALGAVDYIQKPMAADLAESMPAIREKIRAVANARLQLLQREAGKANPVPRRKRSFDPASLIAIGASTGGTEAIRELLSSFPESIPPTLIVQHIPSVFSKAFADRLNAIFPFRVKEAVDSDRVLPNTVYIAPGGKQMRLLQKDQELLLKVDDSEPVNRHRPSVDALFHSIAALRLKKTVACILTGMGGDGARGMLALRELGADTIAQDEATSVVYGMPREAKRIGAAKCVLPLQKIGTAILDRVEIKKERINEALIREK